MLNTLPKLSPELFRRIDLLNGCQGHWLLIRDGEPNHQLAAEQLLSKWVTSDDLAIVGRGHDHKCYYWLVAGAWQLVQAREQIQEDLLALIDSDNQKLNYAICQIIVTNFSKFLL